MLVDLCFLYLVVCILAFHIFYSKVKVTMSHLSQNANSIKDFNHEKENWMLIEKVIHLCLSLTLTKPNFHFQWRWSFEIRR